jgi:hypothetical protein
MWDIAWGSIAVGLVSVLDLVVFGDLVRGEFPDGRPQPVRLRSQRTASCLSLGRANRLPSSLASRSTCSSRNAAAHWIDADTRSPPCLDVNSLALSAEKQRDEPSKLQLCVGSAKAEIGHLISRRLWQTVQC